MNRDLLVQHILSIANDEDVDIQHGCVCMDCARTIAAHPVVVSAVDAFVAAGGSTPDPADTSGPSLDDTDERLIWVLNRCFDEWGPAGVARTVEMLRAEMAAGGSSTPATPQPAEHEFADGYKFLGRDRCSRVYHAGGDLYPECGQRADHPVHNQPAPPAVVECPGCAQPNPITAAHPEWCRRYQRAGTDQGDDK